MGYKTYVAVARSKKDSSIVRAIDFNTSEGARKYVHMLEQVNPEDSVYLKVEECADEHYTFWNKN